jgi:hypothetical protein
MRRCHRRTVPGVTSRSIRTVRGRRRVSAARIARSAQSSRGWDSVRRSTATSRRSTSSSMSLDAVDRPGRTSQPHSRTKIMDSKQRDTTDHHAVRCAGCIDALHRPGRLVTPPHAGCRAGLWPWRRSLWLAVAPRPARRRGLARSRRAPQARASREHARHRHLPPRLWAALRDERPITRPAGPPDHAARGQPGRAPDARRDDRPPAWVRSGPVSQPRGPPAGSGLVRVVTDPDCRAFPGGKASSRQVPAWPPGPGPGHAAAIPVPGAGWLAATWGRG